MCFRSFFHHKIQMQSSICGVATFVQQAVFFWYGVFSRQNMRKKKVFHMLQLQQKNPEVWGLKQYLSVPFMICQALSFLLPFGGFFPPSISLAPNYFPRMLEIFIMWNVNGSFVQFQIDFSSQKDGCFGEVRWIFENWCCFQRNSMTLYSPPHRMVFGKKSVNLGSQARIFRGTVLTCRDL